MRSDFYSLPWAAQRAIRRGERSQYMAEDLASEVRELRAEIGRLKAENAALRAGSTDNVPNS